MGPSADEVYDLVYGSKDYRQEAAIIQRHIARCCQHAETVLDANDCSQLRGIETRLPDSGRGTCIPLIWVSGTM